MKTKTIHIEGMSCMHCSARVEKALNEISGVNATVNLSEKIAIATTDDDISNETLKFAVTEVGYEVTGIE